MTTSNRSSIKGRIAYIGIAVSLFFFLARLVRSGKTKELDRAVTIRLQSQQAPWFSRLMHAVSWAGFPPQSRILPFAMPGLIAALGRKPGLALIQFAGWGTSILSGITKFVMKRPRPFGPEFRISKARIGGTSFPSGHVINYIGIYGTAAYLASRYVKPKALRRAIVGGLSSMIALVGPSRIYLGHHWFTDTLASYLLGSSYLVALISIYERLTGKKKPQ
jgi:undecaprenyl-diphosphatase